MANKSIKMYKTVVDDRLINSVGTCQSCHSEVEYIGKRRILDGFMKGTGFNVHAGKCTKCAREYSISSN